MNPSLFLMMSSALYRLLDEVDAVEAGEIDPVEKHCLNRAKNQRTKDRIEPNSLDNI